VEGPHLYKVDGRYYLLVAEGGTSFNHAVMIAVSDRITGPYTSNPRNPILTSRHLSYDHWVHSTGHADLVELPDGRWYMVALGVRGDEERGSNMGRETHLIPVTWEREPFEWQETKTLWPVCAPRSGRVERVNPLPFEFARQTRPTGFVDNFNAPQLNLEWNSRRLPLPGSHSLQARPGTLRLFARPETIRERGRYNFLGIRQQESNFTFTVGMEFSPQTDGLEAGLVLLQQDENYIKFTLLRQNGQDTLALVLAEPRQPPRLLAQSALKEYAGKIRLKVTSSQHRYSYRYARDKSPKFHPFAETPANHLLSRGYTGAYLGVYASSNGQPSGGYADFYQVHIRTTG
jgi:alpha-N-arabinofuranosidase